MGFVGLAGLLPSFGGAVEGHFARNLKSSTRVDAGGDGAHGCRFIFLEGVSEELAHPSLGCGQDGGGL